MLTAGRLVLIAALLSGISTGEAALVEWDIHGVSFEDGATATGHFTFNSDLNQVTDFHISTSPGATLVSQFNYTPDTANIFQANEPTPGDDFIRLDSKQGVIPGGTRELLLAFGSPLSVGDPITILYQGGVGTTSYETLLAGEVGGGTRLVVGPQVVDPVPEPAAIVSLGIGIALLGGMLTLRGSRGKQPGA